MYIIIITYKARDILILCYNIGKFAFGGLCSLGGDLVVKTADITKLAPTIRARTVQGTGSGFDSQLGFIHTGDADVCAG